MFRSIKLPYSLPGFPVFPDGFCFKKASFPWLLTTWQSYERSVIRRYPPQRKNIFCLGIALKALLHNLLNKVAHFTSIACYKISPSGGERSLFIRYSYAVLH